MADIYTVAYANLTHHLDRLEIPYSGCPVASWIGVPGWKLVFPWCDGDFICHQYSYGGPAGLWESIGMPGDEDDVTGYLTTSQALLKILTAWETREE